MQVTLDALNKRALFSFTDYEWAVLVWARNKHGADTLKDVLRNHLREWWQQREQARLATLAEAIPPDLGD